MKKLFLCLFALLTTAESYARTLSVPAFSGIILNPTQRSVSKMTVVVDYVCYYKKLGVFGESSPVEWTYKSCGSTTTVAELEILDSKNKRIQFKFPETSLKSNVPNYKKIEFKAILKIKYDSFSIIDNKLDYSFMNTKEEVNSFISNHKSIAFIKMNDTKVNFILPDGRSAVNEIRQRFDPRYGLKVETAIHYTNNNLADVSFVPVTGRSGFFKYGLENFNLYPTGTLIAGIDENSEIKFRQRISQWQIGSIPDRFFTNQEASISLKDFDGSYPDSFSNIVVDENWHQ